MTLAMKSIAESLLESSMKVFEVPILPDARDSRRVWLRSAFLRLFLIALASCGVLLIAGIVDLNRKKSSDTTASREAHFLRGSTHCDLVTVSLRFAEELPVTRFFGVVKTAELASQGIWGSAHADVVFCARITTLAS